jgi:hypothetical protein
LAIPGHCLLLCYVGLRPEYGPCRLRQPYSGEKIEGRDPGRNAYRELSREFDWGILWIFVLLMLVVHNMGESSIDTFTSYQTAVVLFMTVSSTRMTGAPPPSPRARKP